MFWHVAAIKSKSVFLLVGFNLKRWDKIKINMKNLRLKFYQTQNCPSSNAGWGVRLWGEVLRSTHKMLQFKWKE